MIYLDNAATTPLSPHILSKLQEVHTEYFANSSSPHFAGADSSKMLNEARRKISTILGIDQNGLYFTSGSTESINMLLQGYAKFLRRSNSIRNEILISNIEHPAVYETAMFLQSEGFVVKTLDNDKYGKVNVEDLKSKLTSRSALVAIMAVNNETGLVQDIELLARTTKEIDEGVLFFSDLVQAIGKISVKNITRNVDSFCGSAHKIGGPKGVGLLYLNTKFRLLPVIYGGSQEHSLRPGTYNTPGAVLLSEALSDRVNNLEKNILHVQTLNRYLEESLERNKIEFTRTIPFELSSPYICSLSFTTDSDSLLEKLSKAKICISKRSACSSQSHTKSRILESMHIDSKRIDKIVRVSFSPENTIPEIDLFVSVLKDIL